MKAFKAWINHLVLKYVGRIEYVVTSVHVSGSVDVGNYSTLKDVNAFVNDINTDRYWDVQKIEKFRRYDFKYHKEVLHSPMHFRIENVTEMETLNTYAFCFLLKHKSLTNTRRVSSKNAIDEETFLNKDFSEVTNQFL